MSTANPLPLPQGVRDVATVTKDGGSLVRNIDGVRTHTPPHHVDHRGTVFEIFTDNEYWDEPVCYSYYFSCRAGAVKGWGVHEHKRDRYCLISGDLLVVLYDGRADSPTRGLVQQVLLSDRGGTRMVTIPIGVWHLNINVGTDEARLINFPTQPYHHDAPDRLLLPWDTDQIPFDARTIRPLR